MKSYYDKEPLRSQSMYADDAPLRWAVDWTTCLPVSLATLLSTATLVMVAILVSRSPDANTSGTCDIYYDMVNSVTRLELQELSSFSIGLSGLPNGANCACQSSSSQAVYVAPTDLCNQDNFPRPANAVTPSLCIGTGATLKALKDHVLVCVDTATIVKLWNSPSKYCHLADGTPRIGQGRLVCMPSDPSASVPSYRLGNAMNELKGQYYSPNTHRNATVKFEATVKLNSANLVTIWNAKMGDATMPTPSTTTPVSQITFAVPTTLQPFDSEWTSFVSSLVASMNLVHTLLHSGTTNIQDGSGSMHRKIIALGKSYAIGISTTSTKIPPVNIVWTATTPYTSATVTSSANTLAAYIATTQDKCATIQAQIDANVKIYDAIIAAHTL